MEDTKTEEAKLIVHNLPVRSVGEGGSVEVKRGAERLLQSAFLPIFYRAITPRRSFTISSGLTARSSRANSNGE